MGGAGIFYSTLQFWTEKKARSGYVENIKDCCGGKWAYCAGEIVSEDSCKVKLS